MPNRPVVDTVIPKEFLSDLQDGIMSYSYRGLPTWKCPFDLAIYMQLLWDLKPATVLEFGSNSGGSALWFADMLGAFGLERSKVYSFDIEPVTDVKDPRIEFLQCDVSRPDASISSDLMDGLHHPVLIIEDSSHQAHHLGALLEYLHRWTEPGDYLVVEDGIITHLGWEQRYGGGPVKAVADFLARHPDDYVIDRQRCDHFGQNVTWNIDGYIMRV